MRIHRGIILWLALLLAARVAGPVTIFAAIDQMPGPVSSQTLGQSASSSASEPMPLTLKQALQMALAEKGNSRVQLADRSIESAKSRAIQARASLLPNLESAVYEQNQTRNLEAVGLRVSVPIPGFEFPTVVGPFRVFDARASASQTVLDLSAVRRYQAARSGVGVAETEADSLKDQVAAEVARTYLMTWQAQSRVDTIRSSVELAQALMQLAESQKQAGTGTGIEVTRARVQLANERQRLLVAQNQYRAAELRLLKVVGLKLTDRVAIAEQFGYEPVQTNLEQSLVRASESRFDLSAQRKREETARLNYSATKWERLPSLMAFGDYGTIGPDLAGSVPTRTYGVMLRLPLFDGGRRDARRAESRIQVEQEEIKTTDLEEQVEMEVRIAFDNLQSAEEQIRVAEEGVSLAEGELAQARRRYEAGVTTSLEVTDAQTRLERARDNRISALFGFQLAKVDLALASGGVQQLMK